MSKFCWLGAGVIPAALDLRRLGWRLLPDDPDCAWPRLVVPAALPFSAWLALTAQSGPRRPLTVMLGIDDPLERSRLLRMGFGEALGWGVTLGELEARAEQVVARAQAVQARRRIGALTLDIVAREGFVAGRPLRLFPREFALLWRLADAPGECVAAEMLLRDVWGLSFRPETNSLAVHVSRLRAKLRIAGLSGLVETTPDGGYRLAAGPPHDFALDASRHLGKEHRQHENWPEQG